MVGRSGSLPEGSREPGQGAATGAHSYNSTATSEYRHRTATTEQLATDEQGAGLPARRRPFVCPRGRGHISRSSTCASPTRYRRAISPLQSSAVRCNRWRHRDTSLLVPDQPPHGRAEFQIGPGRQIGQLHLGEHLGGQPPVPSLCGVPRVTWRAEERCRAGASFRISGSRSTTDPSAGAGTDARPRRPSSARRDVDPPLEQPPHIAEVRLVALGVAAQRAQLGQAQPGQVVLGRLGGRRRVRGAVGALCGRPVRPLRPPAARWYSVCSSASDRPLDRRVGSIVPPQLAPM